MEAFSFVFHQIYVFFSAVIMTSVLFPHWSLLAASSFVFTQPVAFYGQLMIVTIKSEVMK